MARDATLIALKNIGLLLRYISALPLALLPVAWHYDELHAVDGILITSATFLAGGLALSFLPTPREPRLREGLLVAAVGWILVPLGSSLIFLFVEEFRFIDAFFESMSAWTGTGMTVARVPELSRTALAWRSLMQWVGGLGVIVLTLVILARPGTGAHTLYASEGRDDRLRPSIVSTVRTMWWIYLLYTVGAVSLLLATGLPPWDAVNHAMTGISTAGMSVAEKSIGQYNDPQVEAAIVVIMLAGGTAFVAHYALLRGRLRTFFLDEQLRAMLVVAAVTIPFLWWSLSGPFLALSPYAREAVFQGVSAITTTGFQTADISQWPASAKIGIGGVMLLGGAAGSTAGGIKLVRGLLLVKGALWKLERSGLPHFAVVPFRFGGKKLDEGEANEEFAEAAFISFLWVVMLFIGLVGLLAALPPETVVVDVFFDAASAAGNVGLSTGIISSALPDVAKATVILVMWTARLEILPVLLLLREVLRLGKR